MAVLLVGLGDLNFDHSDFFNVDGNYQPRGSGAEDREFAPVEATGNLYRCRKLVAVLFCVSV